MRAILPLLLLLLLASPVVAQPVMPFSPAGGGASGYANDPNACQVDGGANCQMLAQIRGSAGTASLPSFASPLASASDEGLYFPSSTTLGLSVAGALRLTLTPTGLTSTVVFQGPAGTVALPAYSFSGDPNTGIFSAAADDIGFAANGSSELLLNTAALRPATSVGLSLGTVTSGWNQVFSTGGSAAAAFANINDTDTGLYFNGATTVGLTLNNAAFVNLLADRASITTSQGSVDFNNSGSLTMSAVTPTVGLSGGMLAGWHSWGTTANTMRGTAPTAIPSCAASSSGLIVYKEDTDTAGTNSQLCLCARNNAALTYSWIAIGGALTGTCT